MQTPEQVALSFTGKCDPSWLGTSCDAHGSSPLGGAKTCLHVLHLSELIRARDAEVRADERACIAEHAERVIDRVEAMWAEQEGRDDEEEGDVSEAVAMTTIKITEEIDSDGVSTGLRIEPEDAPLVTILGLLRLAEDTAIRASMGDDQ